MKRDDFQRLAEMRLNEARALLNNGFAAGAYYLAGYAVECALKAVISKSTQRYDFPDKARVLQSYEHDPVKLIRVARLESLLEKEKEQNILFNDFWNTVKDWSEESRYRNDIDEKKSRAMLEAVSDPKAGVLRWLKTHW